jgi:hypothetical protein
VSPDASVNGRRKVLSVRKSLATSSARPQASGSLVPPLRPAEQPTPSMLAGIRRIRNCVPSKAVMSLASSCLGLTAD